MLFYPSIFDLLMINFHGFFMFSVSHQKAWDMNLWVDTSTWYNFFSLIIVFSFNIFFLNALVEYNFFSHIFLSFNLGQRAGHVIKWVKLSKWNIPPPKIEVMIGIWGSEATVVFSVKQAWTILSLYIWQSSWKWR